MMAMGKKVRTEALGDIESLLPWHAAGTLGARDASCVDQALAKDPELARHYAAILEEYAETVRLNESLGAPSARAMHRLFAAIDAEPARRSPGSLNLSRITEFFAALSPRTLAAATVVAALALMIQTSVIGALLMQPAGSASAARAERTSIDGRSYALVRFAPDAKVSEIATLLGTYQASIVDVAKGGMFRLQFGDRGMSAGELAGIMGRLQTEKTLSLAVAEQ